MSHELFYTSAPSGIKPGSKGFCTVAMTQGLAPQFQERLESLSGYRFAFEPSGPQADMNPVQWAHWRISVAGKTRSVLTRIASAGADYSGRSNKFAHHVVLEPSEQAPAGPAWLLKQPGVLDKHWSGKPGLLPEGRRIPMGRRDASICTAWAAATGDAGWGGVLAESFLKNAGKPALVIGTADTDYLSLFEEAIALLPESHRWQVTFATYFTDLPAGLTCAWRGVLADGAVARDALKQPGRFTIINLTEAQTMPATSPLVELAHTGKGNVNAAASSVASVPVSRRNAPDLDAVFELDEAEPASVAVGAIASDRTRKVLGASSGGGGTIELADVSGQTWMPPPGTTSVEPLSDINFRASTKRRGRWVVPLLWPVSGLIALLIGLLMGNSGGPATFSNPAKQTATTTAPVSTAQELKDAQDKLIEANNNYSNAKKQLADLQIQLSAMKAEVESLGPPKQTPHESLHDKRDSSNGANTKAIPSKQRELAKEFDGFGNPKNYDEQILSKDILSDPISVEIKMPGSVADQYSVAPHGQMRGFTIEIKKKDRTCEIVYHPSEAEEQLIATISAKKQALSILWKQNSDKKALGYVLPILSVASITIKSDKGEAQVLKCKPTKLKVTDIQLTNLDSTRTSFTSIGIGMQGVSVALINDPKLKLHLVESKEGWQSDSTGGFFRDDFLNFGSDYKLHIMYTTAGISIRSDLPNAVQHEIQGLPKKITDAKTSQSRLALALATLETDIKKTQSKIDEAQRITAEKRTAESKPDNKNQMDGLENEAKQQEANAKRYQLDLNDLNTKVGENKKNTEKFHGDEVDAEDRLHDLNMLVKEKYLGTLELKYGKDVIIAKLRLLPNFAPQK